MSIGLAFTELAASAPVLVLHGLLGCKSVYANIAKALFMSYQVFTLSTRNHGASAHSAKMTYPDMATDICYFIKHHELEPCDIIGHSMGGKASMMMALTRPELISRLLVLAITSLRYNHDYSSYINTMQDIDLSEISWRADDEPIISNTVKHPKIEGFLMQNLVTNDHVEYK